MNRTELKEVHKNCIHECQAKVTDSEFEVSGYFDGNKDQELSILISEDEESLDFDGNPDVVYHCISVQSAFESMIESILIEDTFTVTSVMDVSKEEFEAL